MEIEVEVEAKIGRDIEVEGKLKGGKIIIEIEPKSEAGQKLVTTQGLESMVRLIGEKLEEMYERKQDLAQARSFGELSDEEKKLLLDTKIIDLEMSKRNKRQLSGKGVEHIGQLVILCDSQVLAIKGLGRKSLNEIKDALQDVGLHLGMDPVYLNWQKPGSES